MEWISILNETRKPEKGQIVVAWLSKRKEPACCKYDEDRFGPIFNELVPVDIDNDKEDLISHWLPLPENPT